MANKSFTISGPLSSPFENVEPNNTLTMVVIKKMSGEWTSASTGVTGDSIIVGSTSIPFNPLGPVGPTVKIPLDGNDLGTTGPGSEDNWLEGITGMTPGSSLVSLTGPAFIPSDKITTYIAATGRTGYTAVSGPIFTVPVNNATGAVAGIPVPGSSNDMYPGQATGIEGYGYLVIPGVITGDLVITDPNAIPVIDKISGIKTINKVKKCFGDDGSITTTETQESYEVTSQWAADKGDGTAGWITSLELIDGATDTMLYKNCDNYALPTGPTAPTGGNSLPSALVAGINYGVLPVDTF